MSNRGGTYTDPSGNTLHGDGRAALPPVRSEPLFGKRGWTMDDLKAIAVARCIDLYRGMSSDDLDHAGPLVQDLADIGRDACTPHVPNNRSSVPPAAAGGG